MEKVEIKIVVDKQTGALQVVGQELKIFAVNTESAERSMSLMQIEANKMNEAFNSSKTATAGVTAAMAGLAAAGAVLEFMRAAVNESIHESEALRVLQGSVESTGASWASYKGILEDFAKVQQENTRFQDGETYEVLGKLARATNNVAQAMRATQLAQDLAVKTGKSLAETTETVNNLLLGQERAVRSTNREYGNLAGGAKTAQEALDNLQKSVAGAAASEQSSVKSILQLKAAWGDTLQIVGDAVVPALADVAVAIRDIIVATQEYLRFTDKHTAASKDRVKNLTEERDALVSSAASLSMHAAQTDENVKEQDRLRAAIKAKNLELAAAKEIESKAGEKDSGAAELKARLDIEASKHVAEEKIRIEKELQDELTRQFNDQFELKRIKLEEELAAARQAGIDKVQVISDGHQIELDLAEYKASRLGAIAQEQAAAQAEVDRKMLEQKQKTEKQQQDIEKQRKQNFQSTLEFISSLSTAKNKELALIGKAAGLANAYINTSVAITRALAAAPPPFNFALAAAVGAAGAAQIATIAGVQLKEGGVTTGGSNEGIFAQIGERRRKEGILPLEDPKAMSMVGQAIANAGGAGGGEGSVSVVFGDININIEAANLTDPVAIRQIAVGLALEIQSETEEAIVLARRSSDLNDKNSKRAV